MADIADGGKRAEIMTDTCQETANKTNSKPKEDATDVILLDSLKYRKVDATPEKMAKAVNLARNSVRSRLREFEDLFKTDIGVRESGSTRKGSYQMYPYEALPILRAYLKAERMSNSVRCDEEKLFSRLISELDCEPEWSFAKEYLYSQKAVRDYALKEKVEISIDQRLSLIKELSRELPYKSGETKGHISSYTIGIDTILDQLDNLLMILVDSVYVQKEKADQTIDDNGTQERVKDYVPLDESISKTREELANASYWTKDEAATFWVQAWCQDLSERRKNIERNGKITLSPVVGEPDDPEEKTRARLSKRLKETLSEAERQLYDEFSFALNKIEGRSKSLVQTLSEDGLRQKIYDIMTYHIDPHMDAVYGGATDIDCFYDKSWGVDSITGWFIEDWFRTISYATATLERYVQLLYWCISLTKGKFEMLPAERIYDLKNLAALSCKQIETFWRELKALTKMTDEGYMAEVYKVIPKAKARLYITEDKQDYINWILEMIVIEEKAPPTLNDTLLAGGVTLEFFWRETARMYAENIIRMRKNLQETLGAQGDTATTNKG